MFNGFDVRSVEFRQYFKKGNFDYVGRVNRHSNMRSSETLNSSFTSFCQLKGIPIPDGYRQVRPNMDASFKSVAKYDKNQPALDEQAWSMAGEWTKQHFMCMLGSRETSLEGVLAEMDKSTSAGYPWNLKFKNKRDFLDDPVAVQALSDYWTLIAHPQDVMVPIWTCSQKCELRSVEKLAENNIRTFLASPFEHSSSLNRLCLDMNNRFYDNAGDRIWSIVGMSKFMGGWDKMYNRLARKGDERSAQFERNAHELDESQFDSSLFARALYGQRDIRWSMLCEEDRTPDNWQRLTALYDSVVHSVIVLENGELGQKHTGNPSGSSNTIVDNTMILYRLFAYAWIVLAIEVGREPDYQDFSSNVEAALCGDDNTYTCSDEVVEWFSPAGIARVWSSIGVTTKTPCFQPRPLSEVQFLSNGFVFNHELGMWMPIPESERVLSSMAWGSDIDDVRWHFLRACALRMDSYYNPTCRSTLSAYIVWLANEHKAQMYGSVQRNSGDITMEMIRSNWKSDLWIEGLYGGHESADSERGAAAQVSLSFKILDQQQSLVYNSLSYERLQCKIQSNSRMGKKAKAKKAQKQAAAHAISPQKQKKKKSKQLGKSGAMRMVPVGPGNSVASSKKAGLMNHMVSGATTRRAQTICEDEYIGEVTATATGFATVAFPCNPGQSGTFPWGSKIAALYEEYEFTHLEFYYKREVSEYASLGTTGKIILSFDYDASDIAPTSKQQVEDTVPHMDGMPSTPQISLKIDCARLRKNVAKYVRPGAQPANTDIKTYDCGNLYVSQYGLSASSGTLGELRVRYCCKFSEPVLESGVQLQSTGAHWGTTTATTANNFAGMALQAGGSASLSSVTVSGTSVSFPSAGAAGPYSGSYMALYVASAGTSFGSIGVASVSGGITRAVNIFGNADMLDQGVSVSSAASVTTTPYVGATLFQYSGVAGSIIFNSGTVVTSGAGVVDVIIMAIPSTVLTALEPVKNGEERVAVLEGMVERLMGLLSPSKALRSASCMTADEVSEEAKSLQAKADSDSSDELGSSVHIPRALISQYMRGTK